MTAIRLFSTLDTGNHPTAEPFDASICGFSGMYLTDWTGPEGELKEISFRIGTPCFAGDTMTMTGKVVKKHTEGGQHLVDVEYDFAVPERRNCGGTGTIALPTRG